MKNWKKRVLACGLTGALLVPSMTVQAEEEVSGEVYVFLAASLANAMDEIVEDYKELCPDVEIYCNADSSGTLQTQIQEGARCDIFFSAARKQMNELLEEKLALEETVTDLLENKVVLIKPQGQDTAVTGFEDITAAESLALAGEDVPVGQYSREIFESLGITDEVFAMEINEGKNVTEVLTSVAECSNEVGIVYATDAASMGDQVEILAEAPKGSLKSPVLYPVGQVLDEEAAQEDLAAVQSFLEYLKGEEAGKVFESYGFSLYEETDQAEKDGQENS
ncbi:MAG: molybdate ABC transporter substrate-binding protein [Eubacteriales bacterium]|nr:molybdate ABC transporter substrate-binding protein [Eubacteriales bacterium]